LPAATVQFNHEDTKDIAKKKEDCASGEAPEISFVNPFVPKPASAGPRAISKASPQ